MCIPNSQHPFSINAVIVAQHIWKILHFPDQLLLIIVVRVHGYACSVISPQRNSNLSMTEAMQEL